MSRMREWLKPILFGFVGVFVALAVVQAYTVYMEHRALMQWALQINQQMQRQTPQVPAAPAPISSTPGPKLEKGAGK